MWLLIPIISIIIILGIIFILSLKKNKGKKHEPDYYLFFILGIVWIGAGVPLGTTSNFWTLSIMGLVFMIIGLSHKKEWKKQKRICWKDLSKKEKQIKIWALIILAIGVLALVFYFIFGANVF